MTLGRVAWLVGVALLVLVVNVAASIVYMVLYSYVIDPGHEEQYYKDHIEVAAPYCSVVAGIPLMFLAGWWVGGCWEGQFVAPNPASDRRPARRCGPASRSRRTTGESSAARVGTALRR